MLKVQHRLKKQADFLRAFKEGKKVKLESLIISTVPGVTEFSRFGVVVSKKVSKKAVVRNKIRRSLTALLEPLQQKFSQPLDIVLSVTHLPEAALKSPYRYFQPIIEKWQG